MQGFATPLRKSCALFASAVSFLDDTGENHDSRPGIVSAQASAIRGSAIPGVVILDMLKTGLKPLSKGLYPVGLAAFLTLFGLLLCLGNAVLLYKGVFSADLFLPALLIASGVQIFRRQRSALHLFIAYFILTWIAAIAEVGLDGWSLLPRVDFACGILPFFYLPMILFGAMFDKNSDNGLDSQPTSRRTESKRPWPESWLCTFFAVSRWKE